MIYNDIRKQKREVRIGNLSIGGQNPICIQSMTNTDTEQVDATVSQIKALEDAGCEIVRITVPNLNAVKTIDSIRAAGVKIPVVADIHFDYQIAIACAEAGFDKIRINPGNIGDDGKVKEVVKACLAHKVPIRIGVNSGSLEKHILAKYGAPTADALVESALYHVSLLERFDFNDIVVSIKSSDVPTMISANRLLSASCPYPIHLGVTESGGGERGLVKSAIGLGSLLADGIGDTIRVSLTDSPVEEIKAAKAILQALGIKGKCGLDIVSCPTCGRTKIDLIALVKEFERRVAAEGLSNVPVKVALMGCAVNGPGEAKEADFGIAGGIGEALFFRHGQVVEKISEGAIIERLLSEIRRYCKDT